jgi:hypothetical protein
MLSEFPNLFDFYIPAELKDKIVVSQAENAT